MLSSRTKIIIIITGAVVLFALLVITIFDLWPSKSETETQTPASTTQTDLSFLEEKDAPSGQVFDSSNAKEFAEFAGVPAESKKESPLEQEARQLAEFFAARFGTFSSDAKNAHLDDLDSFMTPGMQAWVRRFRAEQPVREGYFSITTEVGTANRTEFSLPNRKASFDLVVLRTEKSGEKSETYRQKVSVGLIQDEAGKWKVNSIVWGEKVQ